MRNQKAKDLIKFRRYVKKLEPIELIGLCKLLKIDLNTYTTTCGRSFEEMNDEDYIGLFVQMEEAFNAMSDDLRKKMLWLLREAV